MSTYPIVVRLDGTNAEEGRRILADAGNPNIYAEATMLDGAKRAVELAK
jgi:succinyl-CoA synthetase beta subunit